jgi:hypothetical protein
VSAEYLSPKDVCEMIPGMTVANLSELRRTGKGPKYYKPTGLHGKIILYKEVDVRAWIDAGVITTREQR